MPSSVSPAHRALSLAAGALALVYLATMSGHLSSMDGLFMARQGHALVVGPSMRFAGPVWTWTKEPTWNSKYGIGLSLLYVPGMMLASPLAPLVPISVERPASMSAFYLRQLYEDPLYTVGASWVCALVVAATALALGHLALALGGSLRASLWTLAFYGLGSSAFVYARGDFSQPLEGLCWTVAFLGAVRAGAAASSRGLLLCATASAYAVLARPVEGLLLLPALVALLVPQNFRSWSRSDVLRVFAPLAGGLVGVAATLAVNHARYGDAFHSGYDPQEGWNMPEALRLAAVLVSPGRGLLWEFPALLLLPLGIRALVARDHRRFVAVVLSLCSALLISVTCWYMWWGGWCWGLRLFVPALPLLALLASCGIDAMTASTRRWLPATLLLGGLVWALPGVVTDILGGYGEMADGGASAWKLSAYPPFGAWRYCTHLFAAFRTDAAAVDILWFRLAPQTGYWSLAVPLVALGIAAWLVVEVRGAFREHKRDEEASTKLPASGELP